MQNKLLTFFTFLLILTNVNVFSLDAQWKVPHFEKMLYDNGQLLSIYSQAYQLTKRSMYKSVVAKTIQWINREMK